MRHLLLALAVSAAPAAAYAQQAQPAASLAGHKGTVHALAFTPDGKTLVSGGQDGAARLWDVAARKQRAALQHPAPVTAMSLTADGKTLACTGGMLDPKTDRPCPAVCLWDLPAGKPGARFRGPEGRRGGAVALSPDGKTLVADFHEKPAPFLEGLAHVWDLPAGRERTLLDLTSISQALVVSPDGKTLVAAGYERFRVWDLRDGREKKTVKAHPNWAMSAAFAPDGKTLATGSLLEAAVWEVATWRRLQAVNTGLELSFIRAVAFTPDGKALVTAGGFRERSGGFKVWDVAAGKELAGVAGLAGTVHAAAVSPDGRTLATGGEDGAVLLWDVADLLRRGPAPRPGKAADPPREAPPAGAGKD